MRPRDNPFATRRLDRLDYRLEGITWDALIHRLEETGGRGAVVGAHGRGKTALIEALAPRLEVQGYRVRWLRPEDSSRPWKRRFLRDLGRRTGPRDAVLLDCGELLGPVAWWRLRWAVRRAGVLVATLHRPGRLPTLHQCTSSPELLHDLVEELLERPAPELRDSTREFHDRHGGNLRECLLALYDRFGQGSCTTSKT